MGANTSNAYDFSEFKKKKHEEEPPAVESCEQSPLAAGAPIDKSGRVSIKTLGGHVFPIAADPGDLIYTIKEKIQREVKVPLNELHLLYAGQRLQDDRSLSDYGIRHQVTIHLLFGDQGSISTQISLESHSHSSEDQCEINIFYQQKRFTLKIQVASRKVKDLKGLVSNEIYRSTKEFVLLYGGKLLLEEGRVLTEHGIVNQSNIIVIPTSDGGDCLKFTQLVLETGQ